MGRTDAEESFMKLSRTDAENRYVQLLQGRPSPSNTQLQIANQTPKEIVWWIRITIGVLVVLVVLYTPLVTAEERQRMETLLSKGFSKPSRN